MPTYDEYISEWNTKQVTKFGAQCVALIAEYEAENNLPIVWGDAAAWVNNPIMLTHYNWMQNDPNDANQVPNRGDIIVWGPDLPYTNGAGHIAFFDRAIDHEKFMSFGQNSGGAQAHFQEHSWAHVAGWYVSKTAPTPTPSQPTYTVTETYPEGKQVKLNKQPTNLWGMNYHFDYMKDHPVESHNAGEIVTVTNKVHHEDGYDYYRREGQVDGFNVLDCDAYTPPVIPPAAPVPFPGNGEKYEVIVHLNGYQSGTQAGNHTGPATPLEPGEYSIYRYYPNRTDLINITRDKTKPGWWINANDNVIPPPPEPPKPETVPWVSPRGPSVEPEPEVIPVVVNPVPPEADTSWKATFTSYYPNSRKPIRYVMLHDYQVNDLDASGTPMPLKQYSEISLYGTFMKDGIEYGRPKRRDDTYFKFYYGIPITKADGTDAGIVEPEQKVYDPSTTTADREALTKKSHHNYLTPHDYQTLFFAKIEKVVDGIVKRPSSKTKK